jgi:Single-strand binding protein family
MNSVHLIGRLATDVEVKEVNGGSKVSSFILAVDRNAEEADFALLHTKVPAGAGFVGMDPQVASRGLLHRFRTFC